MSYRFAQPDRLAVEIRRVAGERLESALEQLGGGLTENPAVAVHTARKDLKKTRSLLRLTRDSLGEELFRAENDRLRSAAHLLASAREAEAKAEALNALIERFQGTMSVDALSAAGSWLDAMTSDAGAGQDVQLSASRAAVLIGKAREDSRLWGLGHGSFELIAPGIRRTYREGKSGLKAATDDPTDETLHEWRKRVKDRWYELRLVGEVWEPVIRPLADQVHELSELLGDHHDLGEVRVAIESGEAAVPPASRAELSGLATNRQAELHDAAVSLGGRLYAEGPRRYVDWLEGLWRAWELDVSRHAPQAGLPGS